MSFDANETIDRTRQIVKDAGYRISDGRWPYTYHHDLVRILLWDIDDNLSRADVGGAMSAWAAGSDHHPSLSEEIAIWEAISGAARYLLRYQIEGNAVKLAEILDEADAVLAQVNERFLDHYRTVLTERIGLSTMMPGP